MSSKSAMVASETAQVNIRLAFSFFNERLFENRLPTDTVVFWHRAPRAAGYFGPHRFKNDSGTFVSELSLNPDLLGKRSAMDILSTLAHEMCHLERLLLDPQDWPGAYHCVKWVGMMERIGLTPVALGKGGTRNGKKTGNTVTHDINQGGWFEQEAIQFLTSHPNPFPLTAISIAESGLLDKRNLKKCKPTSGGSRTSKLSFHCPVCDARIYGKSDTRAWCEGTESKTHERTMFVLMPKKSERGDQ